MGLAARARGSAMSARSTLLALTSVSRTLPPSSRLFAVFEVGYLRRPMSKSTIRNTPARDRDTVEQRLARMLDSPHLERVVPLLAPETLHRLVLHRGLQSCGELVAFA